MEPAAFGLAPQTILDNQATAVLWLDGALRLHFLNPAAETLLRLDARQVLGRSIADCLPDAGEFAAALERAARSRETFTQRELRLPLNPRESITVDCTATPVIEAEGEVPLLVELAPLDRHLRISRDDAFIAQHAANRVLARNLAHEIRNPLGGMRGAAQLLARRLPDESLREYTGVILKEADRLAALVNAILGPSEAPRPQRVNVHEILEHVLKLVAAEVPAGILLQRDYDPSLPDLSLDRDQMVQALLNIARNACEAVGERGEIIIRTRSLRQFTIGMRRHRLAVSLDIADNGPGIPPELQPRIFAPLVSGKPNGTGLGLSIAQELVNRHGGLIECVSVPGATVFSVILPVEESA